MGCSVRGDKNSMGCFVRVTNLCQMFCPGCQKMAWDVLSWDVLSGSPINIVLEIPLIIECVKYLFIYCI